MWQWFNPCQHALFLPAMHDGPLFTWQWSSGFKEKRVRAEVLLNSNGFKVITDDELFPVDAYLRYLPMCYDYTFDRAYCYRSKYFTQWYRETLTVLWSRRGTEHPGFIAFNRGGEPWFMISSKIKPRMHIFCCWVKRVRGNPITEFLSDAYAGALQSTAFYHRSGWVIWLLADYCDIWA